MKELLERIRRDGKNPGNGILKVDGFINHQVDPALMDFCGRELDARMANILDRAFEGEVLCPRKASTGYN